MDWCIMPVMDTQIDAQLLLELTRSRINQRQALIDTLKRKLDERMRENLPVGNLTAAISMAQVFMNDLKELEAVYAVMATEK